MPIQLNPAPFLCPVTSVQCIARVRRPFTSLPALSVANDDPDSQWNSLKVKMLHHDCATPSPLRCPELLFSFLTSDTSSTGRVLTRGASEGCLDRPSLEARPIVAASSDAAIATVDRQDLEDEDGERGTRMEIDHTRVALLERAQVSKAQHKKVVTFVPQSNSSVSDQAIPQQDTSLRHSSKDSIVTSRLGTGLLPDKQKSGRRYSVDDCGVKIAHRAELQTLQVTI